VARSPRGAPESCQFPGEIGFLTVGLSHQKEEGNLNGPSSRCASIIMSSGECIIAGSWKPAPHLCSERCFQSFQCRRWASSFSAEPTLHIQSSFSPSKVIGFSVCLPQSQPSKVLRKSATYAGLLVTMVTYPRPALLNLPWLFVFSGTR